MDPGASSGDEAEPKSRPMPTDLPTSLDDRRHAPKEYSMPETEMYDGWQGKRTDPTSTPQPSNIFISHSFSISYWKNKV